MQVLLFEEMKYDAAPSADAGMPGTWLRRMVGYTAGGGLNMQPMAGPVPDEGALRFTYLRADGTETTVAPESRNAPCPCGSGRKYKHCHGQAA